MRFTNRTVLVTGGGSGIGRVMAHRFAAEGGAVVVADRFEKLAEKVVREVEAARGKAFAVRADVSQSSDVDAMVALAERKCGPVEVLVNNAAICTADDIVATDEVVWDKDVTVCLKGVFLCSKRVLPRMIERHQGVIVNIASVNGLVYLGNEAYSAAKAGVINLTQSLAVRYGPHGIRANAIAPGTIRTPIWQERVEKEPGLFDRLKKWYPLGRVGEPEDVANAALFLASDEASWISGIVLRVDGGLMAGNGLMTQDLLTEFLE
jgi:meso-butanediol dehydrogenase / (S,S)-butanediol dehydrogenase / diacetyl reductase